VYDILIWRQDQVLTTSLLDVYNTVE